MLKYTYIEVESKNKRIQKLGTFSLNSELEMLYEKSDLYIPLHVHLIFYELNRYPFFIRKHFTS